jgi:hypothetical protein
MIAIWPPNVTGDTGTEALPISFIWRINSSKIKCNDPENPDTNSGGCKLRMPLKWQTLANLNSSIRTFYSNTLSCYSLN